MKRKLYTAKELEQKAGVNPGTLRNLVAAGLPVARKRKSQRGKPANLYDAAAVREWWGHRHIMGKENWTTAAILCRLSKLTGKKKPGKPLPPPTDKELLDLGFDPVSYRKSEAVLNDLINNPPEMPPDPLLDDIDWTAWEASMDAMNADFIKHMPPDPLLEMSDETEKPKPRRPVKTTSPD